MVLYMLGLKQKRRCVLRAMFGTDEMYAEPWLRKVTTRLRFEAFLRQLHFEDSMDVRGEKYEGSVDYRPNGVPKVGLLLEMFRTRCMLFRPESSLSYDEATAKYGGRMTKLKHLQSKYKPYDGVRIYSLNGSKSGYTMNFRVDLRDGSSNEDMMSSVLSPLQGKGYTVWGDNAFVSVAMLRKCKEWKLNFAGTTRTTFGFPRALIDETLDAGEWRWMMTADGLLAAYWSDVGFVKLMSNFHKPDEGLVYRRMTGQADRVARTAPEVGVGYNGGMGGTDLNDWMRGLYTAARIGKKWWKCLFFWVMDASMINAFVNFILRVSRHFAPSCGVNSPSVQKRRYTVSKRKAGDDSGYEGPNGEDKPCAAHAKCAGGELERTALKMFGSRSGRHATPRCRYCWNSNSAKKVKHTTTYQCSVYRHV